jgi:cephalosporin-C deacetylase-like acetyl esterase
MVSWQAMRRRDFLFAASGLSAAAPALAQLVHSRISYPDYSRCLPDYLRRLATEAYEKRNAALAKLTSAESIRARQQWVRETFWKLTGGEPDRTPLNIRTVGEFDRRVYRVEKLVYESRPGLHITANLYIPKQGARPYPGVLFQMGHALNGKASPFYQYCCQGLASLGFLVLAFDPMGQGERTYYPEPRGTRTRLSSADDEHTKPGKQLLLVGDTSTRFQTWDAVRSLDVLAAHPLVDPKRLASTGNSGGGTLTMMLAAVDERLACAAPACPNTENHACANFNAPGSTDDAEQNFIGGGPAGFDRWDTLWPMAPKPLLIMVSGKDFAGTYSPRYIENGREEFGKLWRAYQVMGKPEALGWYETPQPHGLSYDLRMQIYNWFRRWLQGESSPLAREPEVRVEPEEMLWATKSGNVVRELDGKTPLTLARGRAEALVKPKGGIEGLLGVGMDVQWGAAIRLGTAKSRVCDVLALDAPSEPEVRVPAWVFIPHELSADARILMMVEPQGRNVRWAEDGLYQALAARGLIVCATDVRGVGDLTPEFPRGAARSSRSHQEEEHYAWASLMLGRPLVGQRVKDLLAVIEGLAQWPEAKGRRFLLAALGKMCVPALLAAAMNARITGLYLARGLKSYRSLLDGEDYEEPLANFLPNVLEHFDLPEMEAKLGIVTRNDRWDADSLAAFAWQK